MMRRVKVSCGVVELADEEPQAARPQGPPVVLLHGFAGNKDSWLELRKWLRATRRVLSLDLPGHGATEINEDCSPCSIEHTARIAIQVLDALGIARFTLVGYSMGGRLALVIALNYSARLDRLVLESASPGIRDPGDRRARQQADEELSRSIESAGIAAFVSRWESMPLFDSQRSLPAETRERLRRARLSCAAAGLAASLRGMGSGSQPWLGERVRELALPVLIVVGALDAKFMKIGAKLAHGIPGASIATIAGAGHAPHLERPAEFNRIIGQFIGARAYIDEER